MATREELFDAYEATIVSVNEPGYGWTDPALVCAALARPAFVMTAWNPGFDVPTHEENLAANARMLEELTALGYTAWQADGGTADGRYREPGFCVWGITRADALALAARYGQFAVFEYASTGERRVVACDSDAGP